MGVEIVWLVKARSALHVLIRERPVEVRPMTVRPMRMRPVRVRIVAMEDQLAVILGLHLGERFQWRRGEQ